MQILFVRAVKTLDSSNVHCCYKTRFERTGFQTQYGLNDFDKVLTGMRKFYCKHVLVSEQQSDATE